MRERTCGPGLETIRRECTNPPPKNGGANCPGEMFRTRDCNTCGDDQRENVPGKIYTLSTCSILGDLLGLSTEFIDAAVHFDILTAQHPPLNCHHQKCNTTISNSNMVGLVGAKV